MNTVLGSTAKEQVKKRTAAKGLWASKRFRKIVTQAVSLVVVLTVWQIYGQSVNPILFASPQEVAVAFWREILNGTLLPATLSSLSVLVVGFGAGVLLGVPFGLVMGWWEGIDWAAQPYVTAVYATPLVALVPLIILWFGFGFTAKIVIVFLFSVFPLLLNTYQGVKSIDPELLEVAKAFGASQFMTLRHVALPGSIPFIAAGLNIAIGRALVGMVIAEFFTAASGLGYLALEAQNSFKIDELFVPIVVLMILGLLLMSLTKRLQKYVAPWSGPDNRA